MWARQVRHLELGNEIYSNFLITSRFHPYFVQASSKVDEYELMLPSRTVIETDHVSQPEKSGHSLRPTGRLLDVQQHPRFDFQISKKIGSTPLDECYTNLIADRKGIARTIIKFDTFETTIWQDASSFPYIQVYSFDSSKKGNTRRGLAIEPFSCSGFAFTVDGLGKLELQPKQKFKGKWGVKVNNKQLSKL
jgi:aldose 1-epimerase